ncbi:hypothetical protein QJS66_09225 [Kocuria rhizophila]|nr:hypothetical protein QJS66_09225 [Kocuria rhizophila]
MTLLKRVGGVEKRAAETPGVPTTPQTCVSVRTMDENRTGSRAPAAEPARRGRVPGGRHPALACTARPNDEPPEGDPLTGDRGRRLRPPRSVKAELTSAPPPGRSLRRGAKATALMAGDRARPRNAGKLVASQGRGPERALRQERRPPMRTRCAPWRYMADRAADIEDVRARTSAQLRGEDAPGVPQRREPLCSPPRTSRPRTRR